jgi:hypothetical protein
MMAEALDTDLEHLKLLSIFHYVVGGFAALFSLFPVIHLFLGIALITGGLDADEPGGRAMGWFFIAIALLVIVTGLGFAGLIIAAGRYLSRHINYTFCLVIAAVECAFAPFGTVLGVFTIIVLQRPSVKQLFGRAPSPSA